MTGGSRVTFATGKAIVGACEEVIGQLKTRAAQIWGVDPDGITWKDGAAYPSSSNVGEFDPLSLEELAANAQATGGHFGTTVGKTMSGHAPGLSAMFCDVEVDPETGAVEILKFVTCQDAGRAIHPSYVEGQMQGAVAQGVGWALNEGMIYGSDGILQNAGWLDYRMPVASDLPMIDTIIVEVPNPDHPFGVKGVAEASMVSAVGMRGERGVECDRAAHDQPTHEPRDASLPHLMRFRNEQGLSVTCAASSSPETER